MGWNEYGQLGTGDTKARIAPSVLLELGDAARAKAAACGMRHTIFLTGECHAVAPCSTPCIGG